MSSRYRFVMLTGNGRTPSSVDNQCLISDGCMANDRRSWLWSLPPWADYPWKADGCFVLDYREPPDGWNEFEPPEEWRVIAVATDSSVAKAIVRAMNDAFTTKDWARR